MNITRPHETPLLSLLQYVARRAAELGTGVSGSEVIGAMPAFTAALSVLSDALRVPARILRGRVQILWEGLSTEGLNAPDGE